MRILQKDGDFKIQVPILSLGVTLYWRDWVCAFHETTGGDAWPLTHYLEKKNILFNSIDDAQKIYEHFKTGVTHRGYEIMPILERGRYHGWQTAYTIIKFCKRNADPELNHTFKRFAWFSTIEDAIASLDEHLKPVPKWKTVIPNI